MENWHQWFGLIGILSAIYKLRNRPFFAIIKIAIIGSKRKIQAIFIFIFNSPTIPAVVIVGAILYYAG